MRAVWGQGLTADCETLFPGEQPARLAREYDDAFAERVELVRLMDGAGELVAALRGAGIPLALVTNSPVGLARRILDQLQLIDAFRVIAGGDEVARGKPAPDLVLLALRRLGVDGAHSILVGDTSLGRQSYPEDVGDHGGILQLPLPGPDCRL